MPWVTSVLRHWKPTVAFATESLQCSAIVTGTCHEQLTLEARKDKCYLTVILLVHV